MSVKIISHRGANREAPQNTLPAFKRSFEIGVDGIETDVHLTADGVPVICHNYTIDKTSNGRGAIREMNFDVFKQFDFGSYFSYDFEGTKAPSLDELLSLCENQDMSTLNIEIKPSLEHDVSVVKKTIDMVKEHGLFDKPTVLNNVETYANIAQIILKGADWFAGMGTEKSKGTKVFALGGKVNNVGLVEVPMGTTLREVIFDVGGGMRGDGKFKAVQIGGPSGGCLTETELDVPLDFETVKKYGTIIGSGGLVVMDENTCMVDTAKFFMGFTQRESCGKCGPCRIGTKRMLEILERITHYEGTLEDLDLLQELASTITETALCGLGQSACKPVMSTLKYFREDYLRHVVDKHCPLCDGPKKKVVIDPNKCKGCGKCKRNCPMEAISGEVKQPHTVDTAKCITCGACWNNCPFDAITVVEEA